MMRMWLVFVTVGFMGCAMAADTEDAPVPGTAAITFSTASYKGRFAPRHVLAVWVVDSEKKHVKTLLVSGRKYKKHLRQWLRAVQDVDVDAKTGATRRKHQAETIVWDLTDEDGKPVPDGEYRIRFEFTESNKNGPVAELVLAKGTKPVQVEREDAKQFAALRVHYVPKGDD